MLYKLDTCQHVFAYDIDEKMKDDTDQQYTLVQSGSGLSEDIKSIRAGNYLK